MDVDDDDNDDDEILVALEHESRVDESKKGWKDGRRGQRRNTRSDYLFSNKCGVDSARFSETARTQWENAARAASRLPIN